jgi:hypothetical protein
MAVGDIAVLRIVGRYQQQNIVNTMHYRLSVQSTDDAQLWNDLVQAWYNTHSAAWIAEHVDTYTWVGLKAFTAKGDTRPPGERAGAGAGTVAETPAPAFVCRTITFYSDSANPRVRGRLMLSGTSDEMLHDDDGAVVDGQIITMTALGEDLLATIEENGNEYEPVLYNRTADTFANLIAAKGRVTPSSIRSRRIRRMLIG